MLEKILKRMMINARLNYNNELEILVKSKEHNVIIDSFYIDGNPLFSIYLQLTGKITDDVFLQNVELKKEELQTLKELIERILQEISKEIAKNGVTEEGIIHLKTILEFYNIIQGLEYYSNNKIIVYYQEGM